jgi:hypothetical protein
MLRAIHTEFLHPHPQYLPLLTPCLAICSFGDIDFEISVFCSIFFFSFFVCFFPLYPLAVESVEFPLECTAAALYSTAELLCGPGEQAARTTLY